MSHDKCDSSGCNINSGYNASSIVINDNDFVKKITNLGKIEGNYNNSAIDNYGSIDIIDNDNTIYSRFAGIHMRDATSLLNILDNTGTIRGAIVGIDNQGVINNLSNKGEIIGGLDVIRNEYIINNLNLEQNSQLITDIADDNKFGRFISNFGVIHTLTNNTILDGSKLRTSVLNNSQGTIKTIINNETMIGLEYVIKNNATIERLENNSKMSSGDKTIDTTKGSTIGSFINADNIDGKISIYNNGTIGLLANSGTIESKNGAAIQNFGTIGDLILGHTSQLKGLNVAIDNKDTITILNNYSDLQGAIAIQNSKDISSIINNKTISGKNNAINHTAGTITNLINKANAAISGDNQAIAIANGAAITDLNNEASAKISGVNQAIAIANGALITTLNNSGTIESKNVAAIDNDGDIATLNNKAGATISGVNQAITIANGATITTLNNSGTIESKNGAAIDNDGDIATLNNKAGATILGNQAIAIANDATIENFTNAGDIDGKISIYNNGTIGTLDNSGNISGDIYNTSPNTLKVLKNSGNISGDIYNTATGVIGADDKDNAIENTNSIKSINNTGTIKAKMYAIKNETGSIKDIVNNGKIIFKDKHGAQIYNNGTATAAISKWHINLNKNAKEFNDITKIDTKNGNEHIVDERIFVGGNNLKGIKFGKEAIELSAGTAGEYKLSALVLKSDNNNNWITAINDVTGISDDNKFDEKQGLTCSNLKINSQGILVAECIKSNDDAVISITPKKEKSIQTIAPSLWVSNYIMLSAIRYDIVSNTMSSGIGILKEENDGLHVFAIPYANYIKQDTKFGGSHTDTFGIISGAYKGLNEYGVLGVFVGYEQNDASLPQHISANIDTRYVGGSYYNEFPIYSTMHPYIKAFGSYVNTNPNISLLHNTTDTYLNIYNTNLAMGVNVNLDSNIIRPELELEYSIMKLGGINIGKESYSKSTLKIPSVGASLAWTRDYGNNFYSVLQGGVKHLLEDTHKTKLRYDGKYIGEVDGKLSTTYGMAMAGIGYKLNSQTALTLNYQGGFAKDIQSHTGIAKVEYKF